MSDLIKRLRAGYCNNNDTDEAADRIEELAAALHQWDDLIVQQFTGSRSAMSDMTDAAQITAALLHGDAPWPEPRIKKLEAALREIAEANSVRAGTDKDMYRRWRYVATNAIDIARKALEEVDDWLPKLIP